MNTIRLGIIGLGGMGRHHAGLVLQRKIRRCRLTAACDTDSTRLSDLKNSIATFTDPADMFASGLVDAVLIVTPHYSHTTIAIQALQAGLHVLVEKPISVHKADCERLLAVHRRRKQVFAAMFNLRTHPLYRRVKKLVDAGEIGKLSRINWIITNCFRTQAYFDAGGWRATWRGEGGGVLVNQCPHHLDMLQWICGMPSWMRGFCGFGKRHKIEVEDEVTAYFKYKNGATGVFIASTGEAPGADRLEIVGDMGKIVASHGTIELTRNKTSSSTFCKTSKELFATPAATTTTISVKGQGPQHAGIIRNFVAAILDGTPLIAPAREGIHSVELANAMIYSSLQDRPVDLPLDSRAYERCLKKLIRESKSPGKSSKSEKRINMKKSF